MARHHLQPAPGSPEPTPCGWLAAVGVPPRVYELALPTDHMYQRYVPEERKRALAATLAGLSPEDRKALSDPLSDPARFDLGGCNR